MSPPVAKIKIGIQMLDETARIVLHDFPVDMGDHGRVSILKKINVPVMNVGFIRAVFSYASAKTGNCIYREVLEHDDYKGGEYGE